VIFGVAVVFPVVITFGVDIPGGNVASNSKVAMFYLYSLGVTAVLITFAAT